jgi:hypothetical protein
MTPPLLTIEKRCSYLENKVLVEYLPKSRALALIESKKLSSNWDLNLYSTQMASVLYTNETQQIKEYLKLYKNGGFYVKYIKPKHGWGRVMINKSLGLTAFARKTRNTLIQGLHIDIDLKNAQPEIIRNICISNNIPCPIIKEYCLRRKEIFVNIAKLYDNVEPWQIKVLFIR